MVVVIVCSVYTTIPFNVNEHGCDVVIVMDANTTMIERYCYYFFLSLSRCQSPFFFFPFQ